MADERDAWLDKDAAERLLRGEPVEAMDKDVLAGSERLARALRDIAAIAYANDTELPGEAAALAAFRRAGAAGEGSAADPGAGDSVLVRLALAPRAASRSRTGRPVRRRFAVAVAACALGGIAMAAGAGVMPPLFAGEEDPVPANSISSAATPRPFVTSSPADARGTGVPAGGPSADGREQPVPHISSEDGTEGAGGADGAEDTRDNAAHSGQGGQDGQGGDERSFTAASGDKAAAFYRKTLEACRDLRRGTIDEERRQALETLAEGRQEAELFCARLLDGRDGRDGDGNKGGPGDNESDGHGDGSIRNGDADGGGNGGDGAGGGSDGGNGDGSPEGPTLGDPSPHTSPSPTPTPDAPPVPSETPRNPHQDPAPNPHPGSTESLPIPF
ncbi:hypothetical protein ACFXCZ_00615 [Streptomyces sp. NPDC059396]|uniref:hypothetical protein n=1 Tax=Streptomyces sp. NPDC059396 TaxID=3346819 RepID=UPI0036995727